MQSFKFFVKILLFFLSLTLTLLLSLVYFLFVLNDKYISARRTTFRDNVASTSSETVLNVTTVQRIALFEYW